MSYSETAPTETGITLDKTEPSQYGQNHLIEIMYG